jgi:Rrf2 family protein
MRISLKAQYAVRALLDLALHVPPNRGVRSAEIAGRTGVPEKFLEAILRDLREAELVMSKRGPDGGHWLARDPSSITVSVILEAIDGPLSTSASARRRAVPEETCLRSLWGRVEGAAQEVLTAVTLDDLSRQAGAAEALDFTI